MSLGYSPLSATLSIKTRTSSRTSRNPFRASCLFAPPPFPPTASSSALAGPSRLQGRPFSIDSSKPVSRRSRSRKQSESSRSGYIGSSDSSSPPCCQPSTTPLPSPSSSGISLRRSPLHLPPSSRIHALSSSPPPRSHPKPPPWTRSATSSVSSRPFPLHLQQHHLLTTLASFHRSFLLQRTFSSSPSLSKATLAPDSPEQQPPISEAELPLDVDEPSASSVTLHEEQEAILQKVLLGESCFLSGSAGSGKSVLLRAMIAALESRGKRVGITATTGIAAQSLDSEKGRTIHGWSGIRPGDTDATSVVSQKSFEPARQRWTDADVLVVDEISMMSDTFMNLLSNVGKKAREDPQPFGGLQIIFAGDFAQLPPVIKDNSSANGNKHFAFNSNSWKQTLPASKCHFLEHAHRQKDPLFARMLDRMRFGVHSVRDVKLLTSMAADYQKKIKEDPNYQKYSDGIEPTFLCPRNETVDIQNQQRLDALEGEGYDYTALDDNSGAVEKLKNSTRKKLDSPAKALEGLHRETNLLSAFKLKVGARVMIVQNHKISHSQVLKTADDQEAPSIELDTHNGESVHLADAVSGDSLSLGSKKSSEDASTSWLYNGMQGIVEKFVPNGSEEEELEGIELAAKGDKGTEVAQRKLQLKRHFPWSPVVRFTNGSVVRINPIDTQYGKIGAWSKPSATRSQVPLKLAWAMSIHKSQGQTLERAKMDLGNPWEVGQTYVAISRATSLDTLEITHFDSRRVFTDRSVIEFYASFRKESLPDVASSVVPPLIKTRKSLVVEPPSASSEPSPSITVKSSPPPVVPAAPSSPSPRPPPPPLTFPSPPSSPSKPIAASKPPPTPSQDWLHPSPARSTDPYPAYYTPSPMDLDPSFSERQKNTSEIIKLVSTFVRGSGSSRKETAGARISMH